MWWFLGSAALASPYLPEGDRVVQGTVSAFEHGNLRTQWELSQALDFDVMLPSEPAPVICLQVTDLVAGDLFGDTLCFWRLSELAFATRSLSVGDEGLWTIRETTMDEHFFAHEPTAYAPRSPLAPPAAEGLEAQLLLEGRKAFPVLETTIRTGPPEQKHLAMDLVSKYGLLPLIPTVLDALTDTQLAPRPNHPLGEPIAMIAERELLELGERLDGIAPDQRTGGRFSAGTLDPSAQAAAVQTDWRTWWEHWKKNGPPRRENTQPGHK